MTWDHPRGYDPLAACAALWRERTGVEIDWDRRSLQDFEDYPVDRLAEAYDLIVIDHPHVGQVAQSGCLEALDGDPARADALAALAAGSVGGSFESYQWGGRQWALPIDAAAQVQAFRPDLAPAPLRTWDEVMDWARAGRVLCPLRPPHSLMSLYTLCGQLGASPGPTAAGLFDPAVGAQAYARLAGLAALIEPACFDMDPIAVSERLARPSSPAVFAPLIYGYVSYAVPGFRPARLAFADIPEVEGRGPVGSALGGTGVAVSARSRAREAACDFAFWVAGAEVQAGLYARSGGQPAHARAWGDEAVNAAAPDFYRATRPTMDRAWVRPRRDGYMRFQGAASERLNAGLRAGETGEAVIADLNRMFAAVWSETLAT